MGVGGQWAELTGEGCGTSPGDLSQIQTLVPGLVSLTLATWICLNELAGANPIGEAAVQAGEHEINFAAGSPNPALDTGQIILSVCSSTG